MENSRSPTKSSISTWMDSGLTTIVMITTGVCKAMVWSEIRNVDAVVALRSAQPTSTAANKVQQAAPRQKRP
jgi:hypothetical protein